MDEVAQGEGAIGSLGIDCSSVRKGNVEVLFRTIRINFHSFFQALCSVDTEPTDLNLLEHLDQLVSSDVEAEHLIVEGEHGEEVLVLDVPRKPSGTEARHVDEWNVYLRTGVAHEIGHQVTKIVLLVQLWLEYDLGKG